MTGDPLDRRLGRALRALASADVLYNTAVAERLGISPTDLRCLARLDEVGSATPGELARWSGLTSGAITGVVSRLIARGLAVREPDPDDARRVRVSPAAEPSRELEALMGPLGDRLLDTLGPLDDDQREALAAWLAEATRVISAEAVRIRHLDRPAHPPQEPGGRAPDRR